MLGVYEIPFITDSLLSAILEELQGNRKVAITIKNYSLTTLEKPKIHYMSGTSQFGLPSPPLSNSKGLVWGARKTEYSFNGTAGVIVYHIKGYDLSLAFMWSIPLLYVGYKNWWNIKVYEGLIEPNEDLFMKMYYDSPLRGNGNPYSGKLSGGWIYEGTMGDAGQSTIVVSIKDGVNRENTLLK